MNVDEFYIRFIICALDMSTLLFAKYFLLLALSLLHVKISEIQTLKCRTREHTKQEEDFYHLVNKCLKESTNASLNSTVALLDQRDQQMQLQRPQQPPTTQIYQQQPPPQQQQQLRPHQNHYQQQNQQQELRQRHHPLREHAPNRKPTEHHHYNADQHRDSPYGTNKMIKPPMNPEFDYDNGERYRTLPNTCTCISLDGQVHRYGFNEQFRTTPFIPYHEKRETISSQIYGRTNFTTINPALNENSPLENIDGCVVHCIFRELKMLNAEDKVDRQSMLLIMTLRIQEPELKEFIEDSIDECYDFLDTGIRTDNHEELCNISKKLALCLEERAKRACDDWEIVSETPVSTTEFNTSKNFGRPREDEYRYPSGANQRDTGSNSPKNGFNNKWNLNFSPRKPN